MDGLDRVFTMFDPEQLVTVVYGLIDTPTDDSDTPATDHTDGGEGDKRPAEAARLQLISAGHPSPLLLRADGTSRVLSPPEPLLLGVGGGHRQVTTAPIRPGDTVLMFTDGLVERRGESLDDGEDRLAAAATHLYMADLETELSKLAADVRDPDRDDDVAIIALHRR